MADVVDTATRSRMMSGIRGKNTRPEMVVRRYLHAQGFRYRLHDRRLPGQPDIVLPRFRAVVEVRGCFWHRHPGCRFAARPKSNAAFWKAKLDSNVQRDAKTEAELRALGWQVLTIWECEVGNPDRLRAIAGQIRAASPLD